MIELGQAVAGRLEQVEARQAATPREAQQLAQRQETPEGEDLFSCLGAALARPSVVIIEWLSKLLGSRAHAAIQASLSRRDVPPAVSLSAAKIKRIMLQKALPLTLDGLGKASELATLTVERLAKDHTRLASDDGALRSLATAPVGIRDDSLIEASRTQATCLLEQSVGGIALQQ